MRTHLIVQLRKLFRGLRCHVHHYMTHPALQRRIFYSDVHVVSDRLLWWWLRWIKSVVQYNGVTACQVAIDALRDEAEGEGFGTKYLLSLT